MSWIPYDYTDYTHPEPNYDFLVYSEAEKNYFIAHICYYDTIPGIWYEKQTLEAIPEVTYYMKIPRIPAKTASFASDEAMENFIQKHYPWTPNQVQD